MSQVCAYSIFQWSQELLYQRTTREEKFVARGFIDTFVFRTPPQFKDEEHLKKFASTA